MSGSWARARGAAGSGWSRRLKRQAAPIYARKRGPWRPTRAAAPYRRSAGSSASRGRHCSMRSRPGRRIRQEEVQGAPGAADGADIANAVARGLGGRAPRAPIYAATWPTCASGPRGTTSARSSTPATVLASIYFSPVSPNRRAVRAKAVSPVALTFFTDSGHGLTGPSPRQGPSACRTCRLS